MKFKIHKCIPGRRHATRSLLLLTLLTCGIAGCGKTYDVDLFPVVGVVTVDGQPLDGGRVEFQPTGENAAVRGAVGYCNADGQFDLAFIAAQGCPAGDFEVQFFRGGERGGRVKAANLRELSNVAVQPNSSNNFRFDLVSR